MFVYDDDSSVDYEQRGDLYDGLAATSNNRRLASDHGLAVSRRSGKYPSFLAPTGPVTKMDPEVNDSMDYLQLLWPDALCDLIAHETNRYAMHNHKSKWQATTASEIWTFLGIIITMGIHRLPEINHYWSRDTLLGVPAVKSAMTVSRFWSIWTSIHLVDNRSFHDKNDFTYKIKPVLDVLSRTFFEQYNPSQELSVDEAMVKYKGHCRGKVRVPNKPIRVGFKVWSCCCSCCGYLSTFQVYQGKPYNADTGKQCAEVGLVRRVVTDLLSGFKGVNHVVYCDSFFSSAPLADLLANDSIFLTGTVKQNSAGFPTELKQAKPNKGQYLCKSVGSNSFFVFNDRSVVSFITNVFPESMSARVPRTQSGDGVIRLQSVPPLLPAYNRYMGGVDRSDQIKQSYGFNRKSKRYWLRLFFHFFDIAINNAFILYKHSCKQQGVSPSSLLDFRLGLAHSLLDNSQRRNSCKLVRQPGALDSNCLCTLMHVDEIGIKRGKCRNCLRRKVSHVHFTSFGCSVCRVRLCKVTCFDQYHRY